MSFTTHPKTLLGSKEAALLLNCTQKTITRWAADGTLPCIGQLAGRNGALIFSRIDVDKLARKIGPRT